MKPGPKFYEWEKKGVPLRIECGPRDIEAGTLLCARRAGGDGEKFALSNDETLASKVQEELANMQAGLLAAAEKRMEEMTFEVDSYEEMAKALEGSDGSGSPGFSSCRGTATPRRRRRSRKRRRRPSAVTRSISSTRLRGRRAL